MEQLSALFHEKIDPLATAAASDAPLTRQLRYRSAPLYELLLESSDFRYRGQGTRTDYARENFRQGEAILQS